MSETIIAERSSEQILQDVGALLTGHFLLTSGLHSDRYIQGQKSCNTRVTQACLPTASQTRF